MRTSAKYISAFAVAFMSICSCLHAQDLLRYNYIRNGYRYSGTERLRVDNGNGLPLELKLSKVHFKDGADVYILRIDFEDSRAWKMPVNAPLVINTVAGKTINLKHSSSSPNLVAPEGIQTPSGRRYWNYGEYYLELDDLKKIAVGVNSIDATRRWSEDGHVKISYKNDEFGSAILKLFETLENAPVPSGELGSNMKSLQDQRGSRLAETKTVEINDKLSISLLYLYYAPSNSESYDLRIAAPGKTVPLGSSVTIITSDGEKIELKQEKDMVPGHILCYPTIEQLKSMTKGVSGISIETSDTPANMNFQNKAFGNAIKTLYNSVQTIAIL